MKHLRISLPMILLLGFFFAAACSGGGSSRVTSGDLEPSSSPSTSENTPIMVLPADLAQVSSHLTATLAVYDSNSALVETVELSIVDDGAGGSIVTSPAIDLERATTYYFLIIFYYDDVPIAYVLTHQATDNDDSSTITWEDAGIVTDLDGLALDISANPEFDNSALPDLDNDGDGYTNYVEVRSESDPNDADSIPAGLEITDFTASESDDGNTLTLTATLEDIDGVAAAELTFPAAAYLETLTAATQGLSGESGDETRTFTASFNPQYAPLGDLTITLTATNSLDVTTSESISFEITDNGENVAPLIDFEFADDGETLGGTVEVSIRAYDRDGIADLTVTNPTTLTNTSEASDRFIADWDTTSLSDGAFPFRVAATDVLGKAATDAISLTISNGSDQSAPTVTLTIYDSDYNRTFDYQNGECVHGKIAVVANASDPSGVDSLDLSYVSTFGAALGTATSDSDTTYINTIDTTLLTEDGEYKMIFSTADDNGRSALRDYSFTVCNQPDIEAFTVTDGTAEASPDDLLTLSASELTFAWTVADFDELTLTNTRTNETVAEGLEEEGSLSLSGFTAGTYRLTATRQTNLGDYSASEEVFIDIDDDADEVGSLSDNCGDLTNADQDDNDGDGSGDDCDGDDDGDGFIAMADGGDDCDDRDATISPLVTEVCDGIDNDCDGDTDEGSAADAATWYADDDADGFGDAAVSQTACSQPDGYVSDDSDCDDASAAINTTATETCDDIDNDCDGTTDENDASDSSTWYRDADGDGFGNASITEQSCEQPSGYVPDASDCDDGNSAVRPTATEVCDTVDNDCDGQSDESSASDASTWYRDADSDTYGNASSSTVACDQPSGYVSNDDDCNDSVSAINPAATEVCDDVDNDCDGTVDENDASDASTWYRDADTDTYGNASSSTVACDQPTGYVSNDDDCNDSVSAINPTATEVCDDVDNDCDGTVDENDASDASTWHRDADGDGFGNASVTVQSCEQPSGYVADASDCDDGDGAVRPTATEVCDTVDNDCDGTTDENDASDASTWYRDADSDTYGNASVNSRACDQPTGYVANDDDCNDASAAINPAATEVCDDVDNDCDGTTDENDASDASTWYRDADTDTYGNATSSTRACDQPTGYVSNDDDCNDASAAINPAATEVCDDVDNDCDGFTDETSSSDAALWYLDADADTYGDANNNYRACDQPTGYVSNGDDCVDSNADVNPDEEEVCDDSLDNDCSGEVDRGAGMICLTAADVKLTGQNAYDQFGFSVAGVGDMNNDGFDDVVIGAPQIATAGTGLVYTFLGDTNAEFSSYYSKFTGSTNGSMAGYSVAGGFRGFVYPDFLVGAFAGGGDEEGEVFMVLPSIEGTAGTHNLEDYSLTYSGESNGYQTGYSVAGMGDFNGDGWDDVVIGAPGHSGGGAVYVNYHEAVMSSESLSTADVKFTAQTDSDQFGAAVAWAGDVNADGCDDILVGAPNGDCGGGVRCGIVYLIYGAGDACTHTTEHSGTIALDDIEGSTYRPSDGVHAISFEGAAAGDAAGFAVVGAGDINDDGADDFLIGAYGNDDIASNAGAVYIVWGATSGLNSQNVSDLESSFVGEAMGDSSGIAVAAAGDVNSDGYDDFLIGSQGNDESTTNAGAAYLIFGATRSTFGGVFSLSDVGGVVDGFKILGESFGDEAGTSVAGAGDVNADGYDDIIIGAPLNGSAGNYAGAVFIILGDPDL